ncbi:efflux RND transporter permease subunit [Bacillus badius]|uniref:efflux RND transporter permease subunit n=1 Tax=Bacillus badius TaxID=1455 RepID=UPI0007B04108|nr:efflux RND transporter permease subunit [Bacillus badius]KZO01102.1 multidrug transporter AcrB [Bacillus badius]MED0667954.1 efflux RND transporter permease subunit [Bacillus badius]OCS89151.1 multidrug transporter AcrB [Bacillus badius]OVE50917.1 multidrug transporter AcrB [Bacillus badius]TDW01637.1 HAE1 family hydrophobic/amphiphilic exporter-1 [Bacillus badius]
MNFLTKFSLKNAVAVFIISFLLILGGIYSFSKLKVDQFPDIEFPKISIEAVYPGASPDDVDKQVVSKLENQLNSIEGVTKVTSSAYDSIGMITLEFPFDTDLDKVEQQVNSAVEEASLPDEAEVKLNRLSFGAFPIYNISVFSKDGSNIERLMKDEVIPELKKIKGINNVSVAGLTDNLVQITIDKEKAEKAGLSLSSIKEQINEKYLSFPAGELTENQQQIPIRVEESLETLDKLENLQITSAFGAAAPGTQGVPSQPAEAVRLKDIASIKQVTDKSEIARYNEKESLSMAITKKQDANTVEVADKVMDILKKYDDKIAYEIGIDSAKDIEKSVSTLVKEGLLGALFASIAVLVFLRNARATVIAVISIPLSLLIGAIFLKQLDVSLNIMTLGGMAVAVGRVVDDSIVVIENIFRRVRKSSEGMSNTVILESTKEILKAITSSTLTTVVVFLPIGFVGGITGKFFLPFALTIVFSLLASLLVAITIVPILAKFSFKKVPPEEKEGALQKLYGRLIEKSLNHKFIILFASVLLLAGSFAVVPSLGFTFIPNEQSKTLTASIELPSSASLEKTNTVSLLVEDMFSKQKEIADVTASVGARDFATGLRLDNKASYFVNLKDNADVERTIQSLEKKMESISKEQQADLKISVQELETGGPPSNNNVDVDLFSNDLEALQKASKQVEAYMQKNNELKYVTNNFSEKQQQFLVEIDPDQASEYGLSGFQILGTVSDQTKPVNVGTLTLDGKEQKVQVSFDKALQSKDELEDVTLFSQKGPVKLSEIADVQQIDAFTSVQKLDGKVYARVSGQVKGNDVQAVSSEVKAGVEKLDLPDGVSLTSGGGNDETVEIFQSLGIAIVVAIGLVYLTMLITFGKARIPFVILSSLIFVPIGSLVSLYIVKEPLSVSVMIGFLMLIGIVTTNAIVLVDRVGQNRSRGLTIRASLVEAGKTRLRPILMTAFATIAALIPLAMTTSSGTLISKGLAVTVIGGLTSSTLLTLIIVPVVYELFFFKTSKKERGLTGK